MINLCPDLSIIFSVRRTLEMEPRLFKVKFKVKPEEGSVNNATDNSSLTSMEREQGNPCEYAFPAVPETTQTAVDVSCGEGEEDHCTENEENHSSENAHNQLVLYDPSINGCGEIIPAPNPIASEPPPSRRYSFPHQTSRVLPSVGAFTVQCANCFKWRLIPTKEKYEEIREHILEHPFVCETAQEWRPDISCDDEPDIEQDGSRLWAIDKPNIAQPPPGWQRLLRIRGEGSTKFADVYYESPSGKRLRSMVEIHKYLEEHPEYREGGVTLARFSFQIPRPLQENYVRKRPRSVPSHEEKVQELGVNPIAWAGPDEDVDLQLGGPRYHSSYEDPLPVSVHQPVKKKRTPSKRRYNGDSEGSSSKVNVEETLKL
ncbi:hypothetical protein ACH5RR_006760 [Cinchona calisaya]|uniref:Methyl-CpG-binding domain-containing protein 2 n=1 Tax=Cinchona calisaya TaxID=153742 RepID=A0ABD3AQC7_9GENT